MGLRMQPRNEKFFTVFTKAGSNVVESAGILVEFVAAPHERWAELAERITCLAYFGVMDGGWNEAVRKDDPEEVRQLPGRACGRWLV